MNSQDQKPLVSIGVPVYNEERFLTEALDSLLRQAFRDFEIVICDNSSTDDTKKICLRFAGQDSRVRYNCAEANVGSITNYNRAFRLSRGKYFCWASGHDLRHETFLSRCVEVLEEDESVALCCPLARWLEPNGQISEVIIGQLETRGLDQISAFETVLWGLGYGYPIYGVIRAAILGNTGLMRRTVGPDNVLLAEISLLGKIALLPEPLLYLRRLADYGSWDHYLAKSFGPAVGGHSARGLYARWVLEHLRVVARHAGGFRKKTLLMSSVLACFLTKYRWALRELKGRDRTLAETRRAG